MDFKDVFLIICNVFYFFLSTFISFTKNIIALKHIQYIKKLPKH